MPLKSGHCQYDPYRRFGFAAVGGLYYENFHPTEVVAVDGIITQFAKTHFSRFSDELLVEVVHVLPIFKVFNFRSNIHFEDVFDTETLANYHGEEDGKTKMALSSTDGVKISQRTIRARLQEKMQQVPAIKHLGYLRTSIQQSSSPLMRLRETDSVIRVEDTELESAPKDADGEDMEEDQVKTLAQVSLGENVRQPGSDMHKGELVMQIGEVKVFRKPVIALLSTGNNLLDLQSHKPISGDEWGGI
ncbi:hypothetical protein BKA83DRAFT_4131654 [Pisolithus microcarpus]|nr:hypothetical protein BKA83DRAFT_4131654 [Pisolithus microcarpus]